MLPKIAVAVVNKAAGAFGPAVPSRKPSANQSGCIPEQTMGSTPGDQDAPGFVFMAKLGPTLGPTSACKTD